MIIEKIILKNFRTHSDFTFEPAETGITAISGVNGSGKSTIVDGFSWSLFGTRLHGMKNSNYIKEAVNPKEHEVSVASFIKINSNQYKIKRTINNDKGNSQCYVYFKKPDGKYEEVAGPAITHAEEYIRRILNLDEKGFLTSVFVQQKQVDEIVSATPTQRGAVIEKMLGIDALSSGIQSAKDESRGLQKAANVVRRGDLDQSKKDLEEQEKNLTKTLIDLDNAKKEVDTLKVEKDKLSQVIEKEEAKIEQGKSLKIEFNNLRDLLNSKVKDNESNMNLYKSIKKSTGVNIPEEELNKKSKQLETNIKNINTKIVDLSVLTEQDKKIVEQVINEKAILELDINRNIKSDLEKEQEELSLTLGNIKSEAMRNQQMQKLIKEGNATCPTCGQDIEANDDHAKEIENNLKELKKDHNKTVQELEKNKTSMMNINKEIELGEQNIQLKQDKTTAKDRYDKNLIELTRIKSELLTLEAENKVILKNLAEINEIKEKEKLKSQLKVKIKNTDNEITELNNKLQVVKDNAMKIKDSLSATFNEDKQKLKNIETQYNNNLMSVERLTERSKQEQSLVNILSKQYKDNLEAENKYQELIKSLSVLNHTVQSLSNFKEDRLLRSIPQLTDTASDIMNKFTSGEFTHIHLDDKFKCSVTTKEGIVRPVEQLSGGELSMAAIALRFAISFFLSNMSDNLLILDEVLVSMSEERAQKALEVINSIENTQIILIAHNEYATDIADRVISLS